GPALPGTPKGGSQGPQPRCRQHAWHLKHRVSGQRIDGSDMNVVTSERNAEGETAMGNGASGAIRVLIADDHPLIIAGVRRTIEQSEDFEVVGEARSGPELLTLVERRSPDIVLLDLRMPGVAGVEHIQQIRERWP